MLYLFRSIQAMILLVIMAYIPLLVGYRNVQGESLTSIEAFFAGVAVMCYVGLLNRGINNGEDTKTKG